MHLAHARKRGFVSVVFGCVAVLALCVLLGVGYFLYAAALLEREAAEYMQVATGPEDSDMDMHTARQLQSVVSAAEDVVDDGDYNNTTL